MSCYDVLLEEFNEEQELANATFSSIAESVNALYEFVAQDINLEFSISCESAQDIEALKEAAGAAVKERLVKLGQKLKEWAIKVVEQVKKIAKKAAIAAATGGNAVMKKLISQKAVTKKDIQLSKSKYSRSENSKIFEKLMEATHLNTAAGKGKMVDEIFGSKDKFNEIKVDIKAGQSAKDLYKDYVDMYIAGIDYNKVVKCIEDAAKEANKLAKELEGEEHETAAKDAALLMKGGTNLINYAFRNISIGVANAAKIALACGAVAKKDKEEKEEK